MKDIDVIKGIMINNSNGTIDSLVPQVDFLDH